MDAELRGNIHELCNPLNWLNRQRSISAAAEWRTVGTQLRLSNAELERIHRDHGLYGSKECLRETLAHWLRNDPAVSWRKLERAVTNTKRYVVRMQ